jgi:hypothetical protein
MVLFFICYFVGLFNKNALSTNLDFYLILDWALFLSKNKYTRKRGTFSLDGV